MTELLNWYGVCDGDLYKEITWPSILFLSDFTDNTLL